MIPYYLDLLADPERIEAFDRAIGEAVRPHDVVVDLGCGIGTFAVFAARAGARRVFRVESSPAIEKGKVHKGVYDYWHQTVQVIHAGRYARRRE